MLHEQQNSRLLISKCSASDIIPTIEEPDNEPGQGAWERMPSVQRRRIAAPEHGQEALTIEDSEHSDISKLSMPIGEDAISIEDRQTPASIPKPNLDYTPPRTIRTCTFDANIERIESAAFRPKIGDESSLDPPQHDEPKLCRMTAYRTLSTNLKLHGNRGC